VGDDDTCERHERARGRWGWGRVIAGAVIQRAGGDRRGGGWLGPAGGMVSGAAGAGMRAGGMRAGGVDVVAGRGAAQDGWARFSAGGARRGF
jgi:hypothetical protein